MIKRINTLFFSFKSSVKNKPMALVMLLIVIIVSVAACGFITRGILQVVDAALYSNLKFDIPAQTSFNDRGEMMRALRKNGLFSYDAMCDISCDFNLVIKVNGAETAEKIRGRMEFNVFEGRYITEREIVEASRDIVIKTGLAQQLSCKVGDELIISGSAYRVKDIIPDSTGYADGDIIMPYTAAPSGIEYKERSYGVNQDTEALFYNFSTFHYGLNRLVNKSDSSILSIYGVSAITEKSDNSPIIMLSALLVLFTALAVGNLIFIIKYYEKVNAKKFAVYNIVGAKPRFIGASMFAEVMSVTIVGIGLGALADYLINLGVQAFEFKDRLLWAHYLISTGVIFITALIAITIMIIRRRKAQPIDRRYM